MATGTIKKLHDTDSGWIDLTLTSDFAPYNTVSVCRCRKNGKMVQVVGQIKPVNAITQSASGSPVTIATLPTGFQPPSAIVLVCQGSGMNRFCVQFNGRNDRTFGVSRYGTTEFTDIPAGAWLTFHVMYFVD